MKLNAILSKQLQSTNKNVMIATMQEKLSIITKLLQTIIINYYYYC